VQILILTSSGIRQDGYWVDVGVAAPAPGRGLARGLWGCLIGAGPRTPTQRPRSCPACDHTVVERPAGGVAGAGPALVHSPIVGGFDSAPFGMEWRGWRRPGWRNSPRPIRRREGPNISASRWANPLPGSNGDQKPREKRSSSQLSWLHWHLSLIRSDLGWLPGWRRSNDPGGIRANAQADMASGPLESGNFTHRALHEKKSCDNRPLFLGRNLAYRFQDAAPRNDARDMRTEDYKK
jgi:hypothetical protein